MLRRQIVSRMLSTRKLEANRENAKKSTGPRTMTGRERSSRNALVHGLCSAKIVILDEDSEEYDRLLQALVDDWGPCTATEMLLVEVLAWRFWQLRWVATFQAEFFSLWADEVPLKIENFNEYVKTEARRRATRDTIAMLCSADDQVLDEDKVAILLDGCAVAVGEEFRATFLGGGSEPIAAFAAFTSVRPYTVGAVKQFITAAEKRLAAQASRPDIFPPTAPNLIVGVLQFWASGGLMRPSTELERHRRAGQRTEAL